MDDKSKNHPDFKRLQKGISRNNYKPITLQSVMWKILTAQISKEIYDSLISYQLFFVEKKGWCKWIRGSGGLLFIEQHILKESKTRCKQLAMACIDDKSHVIQSNISW